MSNFILDIDMRNQTSPGVQSRRYRLLSLCNPPRNEDGSDDFFAHKAKLQLVTEGPDDEHLWPFRLIDSAFLPMTSEEGLAYVGEEKELCDNEPIEYEITVRRVKPTAKFVSKLDEWRQEEAGKKIRSAQAAEDAQYGSGGIPR